MKYAGALTVVTALLISGCQSVSKAQFEAERERLQSPQQRVAAIQWCLKGVTPRNWGDRPAPPGAVKWCTMYVNNVASGRWTYDYFSRKPEIGYDYRRDRIVKLP